ncbi:secreted RxLR effector protein 161-like [Vigna umbellata]|uniref:secreted RxLR effector protein 161-like n=1 Tax=Vigna umbellata TaxID=87088 RepID=UPI001F5F2E29|nr:secreted RxLR effector protein 161-like [Vigna umbellata]
MVDCNKANTPAEVGLRLEKEPEEEEVVDPTAYKRMVGSLRYLCNTRPDLSYSVEVISRYMECPRVSHLNAVKRILRYLKGTYSYGILLRRGEAGEEVQITSYSDADWCGDKTDKRSTAGYIFFMGGSPISWCSRKEPVVALSSCEAEYIAACEATCQATWLGFLLEGMKVKMSERMRLLVDNKSAIDLTKHPTSHGRSKHIETRFHYIREQVSNGSLKVVHCRSEDQLADILTKALKGERFLTLRK